MILTVLIILATIMAISGVIGYLRGTAAGVLATVLIWGGLLAEGLFGTQVAQIVNGLNYGVRFVSSGGLQALSGGNIGQAVDQVTTRMGTVPQLLTKDNPGAGVLLVLGICVVLALLLGLLKTFRGRPSALGLVLGLVNGYVITGALLYGLAPDLALLPMPFGFSNQTAAATVTASGGLPGPSLLTRMTDSMKTLAGSPSCPVIIAIAIAAFVFIAVRSGNRSKKG